MSIVIRLFKNCLELIGVLLKFMLFKVDQHIENIAGKNYTEKKELVYSSLIAREDEEKEAITRQRAMVSVFNTELEDEYLYATGTRWSSDNDYEEPIGI
jgi:hypothetical protein